MINVHVTLSATLQSALYLELSVLIKCLCFCEKKNAFVLCWQQLMQQNYQFSHFYLLMVSYVTCLDSSILEYNMHCYTEQENV